MPNIFQSKQQIIQQFRDLFIRSYTKIGITTQKIIQFAERQLETNAFLSKIQAFFFSAYYQISTSVLFMKKYLNFLTDQNALFLSFHSLERAVLRQLIFRY